MNTPVAVFEETGKTRTVTHWCLKCRVSREDWPNVLVSPTGTAHLQHDDGMETTRCGVDATGDEWWWKT